MQPCEHLEIENCSKMKKWRKEPIWTVIMFYMWRKEVHQDSLCGLGPLEPPPAELREPEEDLMKVSETVQGNWRAGESANVNININVNVNVNINANLNVKANVRTRGELEEDSMKVSPNAQGNCPRKLPKETGELVNLPRPMPMPTSTSKSTSTTEAAGVCYRRRSFLSLRLFLWINFCTKCFYNVTFGQISICKFWRVQTCRSRVFP